MRIKDREYIPDEWCLVRINDDLVKVFGSWRGGYVSGDNWRLNSGIENVKEEDDFYLFEGHSGSVYVCYKKNYGIRSLYNLGVLYDADLKPMEEELAKEYINEKLDV